MQQHALLTLFGLILAALVVAWIQPNTNGGTTFLVVVVLLLANAFGAITIRFRGRRQGTPKAPDLVTAARDTAKVKAPRK